MAGRVRAPFLEGPENPLAAQGQDALGTLQHGLGRGADHQQQKLWLREFDRLLDEGQAHRLFSGRRGWGCRADA
jgi:hypothetical protein